MLLLSAEHKKHVQFLAEQSSQVIADCCKLTMDYLQKGPNYKLYTAAAQKLEVEPDIIQSSIEGLVYLLTESSKHKLSPENFEELIISLGFDDEKKLILMNLYKNKQSEIEKALANIGFRLPQYHNMEWRFETQIASRSMLKQVNPLITMDFSLKIADQSKDLQHIVLQTDATNLLHLAQELEAAMQEGHSQHLRKIKRLIKQ